MKEEVTYFVLPASGWIEFCAWAIVFLLVFAVVLYIIEMLYNVHDGVQLNAYYRRVIAAYEIRLDEQNDKLEAQKKLIDELRTAVYQLQNQRRG